MMNIENVTKKHYSFVIENDINIICNPLQTLNITSFWYCRIFNDNSLYVLTNKSDSYFNHLKQQFPFDRPLPKNMAKNEFHYLPFLDSNISYKQLQEYKDKFNAATPIYFVEIYDGYTDLYIYASKPDDHQAINNYMNNLDFLEKFKFYLKDKANQLITKLNKDKIILSNHMWSNFGRKKPTHLPNKQEKFAENLLAAKHYTIRIANKEITMTKREVDVLKLLARGATLKETAVIHGLSPRTVETYLNRAKNKLNFKNKLEIYQIFSKAHLL